MNDNQIQLNNLDKIHTTEMGAERKKRTSNYELMTSLNIVKIKVQN